MSDQKSVQTEDQLVIEPVTSEDNGTPMGLGSRIAARFRELGFEEEIQELRGCPAVPAEFDP
jgi:hypothetical protein